MNAQTKDIISSDILTISEVAALLGLSVAAAMKRAERKEWDYVLKGRQKLYWRPDFDLEHLHDTPDNQETYLRKSSA